MTSKIYHPVVVALGGLIGFLGIAWGCDALMQFLRYQNAQTFNLSFVIFWAYALIAMVLAAAWLSLAWLVLVHLPGNAWVSLVNLLCGAFIVTYPVLYYTPALGLPDIKPMQFFGLTMNLYFSGGCVAVIGLAGLVWRKRK
jgi:hypothetical protein